MIDPNIKKNYQLASEKMLNTVVESAARSGNLEVIEYLFFSTELKNHANIKEIGNEVLGIACGHGNLDIVEYLLTNENTKNFIDITYEESLCLYKACWNGNVEVVRYLLTSEKLLIHADPYIETTISLHAIFENPKITNYILDEYNLKITPYIENYLIKNNVELLKKIQFNRLDKLLTHKVDQKEILKIKI